MCIKVRSQKGESENQPEEQVVLPEGFSAHCCFTTLIQVKSF